MPERKPDIEATEPGLSSSGNSSKTDLGTTRHMEDANHASSAPRKASVAAKLRNPLTGFTEEQVLIDVETWCAEKGLTEDLDSFRKGALIARVGQRDDGFEYVNILSEEEKEWLRHETTHRWSQPFMLYFLVVLCAGSAIVQGMDQTAVNGAQLFYFEEFGITDVWLQVSRIWFFGGIADFIRVCLTVPHTCAPLSSVVGRTRPSTNTLDAVVPSSFPALSRSLLVYGWLRPTTGLTCSFRDSFSVSPSEQSPRPLPSTLQSLRQRTFVVP
jgi:hypothetical protein